MNISYQPTEGLSYDPEEPRYWDEEALGGEMSRVFEICHGCRMCFKYCDSFPDLFRLIDKKHDGDVRKLTAPETDRVMDACFQCKLCEVQCPYTPRDGHEFQLDFPKLVHRYQAQRAKTRPQSLSDALLSDPDQAGRRARRDCPSERTWAAPRGRSSRSAPAARSGRRRSRAPPESCRGYTRSRRIRRCPSRTRSARATGSAPLDRQIRPVRLPSTMCPASLWCQSAGRGSGLPAGRCSGPRPTA